MSNKLDETTLIPNKTKSKVNNITKEKKKYLIIITHKILSIKEKVKERQRSGREEWARDLNWHFTKETCKWHINI